MPLPDPDTPEGRAGLVALLAEPARAVVAVDFDGTLAPIVADPQDARPAAGAVPALTVLAGRIGCLAVLTGRPAAEVVRLAGLADVPRLLVLGHYGLQRLQAGRLTEPAPDPGVAAARRRLPEVLAAAPDGVRVEDKQLSVAVHTRSAADPAGTLAALHGPLAALAAKTGLSLQAGRYVLELRPRLTDKGSALRSLVEERRAAAVVVVGDDLGDLPAFAVVRQLRGQGVPGVCVASVDRRTGEVPPDLAAAADLTLDGPAGVVAFLVGLAGAVGDVP